MNMLLLAAIRPVLAIQISTILLIAGVICAVIAVVSILMRKKSSKAPDSPAEVPADMDCAAVASGILAAMGGRDNISGADCCATRLRLNIRDYTAVNEKAVKAAGALGVALSKNTCQVTLGSQAGTVCDELKKLL